MENINKLEEVIKILKEIQSTSSKNEKQSIITANQDNKLFKQCLVFLLDSQIVTGISKKKYNKITINTSDWEHKDIAEEFCFLLDYIRNNNTGKDDDVIMCKIWCYGLGEEIQTFTEGMITKSIKLGCDTKTVNKAIPGLIEVYETQQAYPLSDKNMPKDGEWFSLSEKINGTNCGIKNGECISRQGKPFSNMNHIVEEIKQFGLSDMYVNGELVRMNVDNIPDDENFQKSVSIINSDAMDKTEIGFIFYEVLTMDEFASGKSVLTYKQRLQKYFEINEKIKELGLKYIKFINHFYAGTNKAEIQKWLDYADSHNMEGCMLNKDTHWENKRNNGICKVKSFKHCDVRCKDVVIGDGKYSDTLGKIVCDYKGFDLGVGSGFTDEQRKEYWEHPERIVGKIVTVKYKCETKNQNGGISVQFPTFCVVREDKTEPSYN